MNDSELKSLAVSTIAKTFLVVLITGTSFIACLPSARIDQGGAPEEASVLSRVPPALPTTWVELAERGYQIFHLNDGSAIPGIISGLDNEGAFIEDLEGRLRAYVNFRHFASATPIEEQSRLKGAKPKLVRHDIDEAPAPVGGIKAVQKNLVYPVDARGTGLRGRVDLTCYVEETGIATAIMVTFVDLEVIQGSWVPDDRWRRKTTFRGSPRAALSNQIVMAITVAVMKTAFKPGKHGGHTVGAWTSFSVPVSRF